MIGTLAWASTITSIKTYRFPARSKVIITTASASFPEFMYSPEELKEALRRLAIQYGGNYTLLSSCIKNESQFQAFPKKPGDGGLAIGPAQIHADYWHDYCNGKPLDRYDPLKNLECFVQNNIKKPDYSWSCWKKVFSK